jgi:polyferredoxin
VRLFLDFDPLILISTLLSSHAAAKAFYLSIATIIITLLLGRVFCGWACPLGTLNNMVGSIRHNAAGHRGRGWYRVKYYVLTGMLASAIFTLQPVGIMDPLSLLIRSFSISVYPLFNYGVRSVFDTIYSVNPVGLASFTEPVYTVLKKTVLSFEQSL